MPLPLPRPPVAVSTGVFACPPDLLAPEAIVRAMEAIAAPAYEVLLFRAWDDRRRAVEVLARAGLPVLTLHAAKETGSLLGHPDPRARRQGHERVWEALEAASRLGAREIVLHLWAEPESDARLEESAFGLAQALAEAGPTGARLLIETLPCRLGTPWEQADRALALLEGLGVARERVGVNLDFEFLAWHDGLDLTFRAWAPRWGRRVGGVHVKDYDGRPRDAQGVRRFVNPGDGRLNLPAALRALRDLGYAGPLVFEGNVTASRDVPTILRQARRYLERLQTWVDEVWSEAG